MSTNTLEVNQKHKKVSSDKLEEIFEMKAESTLVNLGARGGGIEQNKKCWFIA